MINEIFQSIHESVKKRYTPDQFMPVDQNNLKDVIHRGYLRGTMYPIRYDMIPDGKTKNTGIHIYNCKLGNASGFITIDHAYAPTQSGHETKSKINFELEGNPDDEMIQIYRSFIVPSILHHDKSHKPDIIVFPSSMLHVDDIVRRLGSSFDTTETNEIIKATRKMDPKIDRILTHIKSSINNNKGK